MNKCEQCENKTHKIYYGEMTESDMKLYGVEYHKCLNCEYSPLIWNMGIGDASCESCGEWQNDILPDGLRANEIEKWYHEREKGNE